MIDSSSRRALRPDGPGVALGFFLPMAQVVALIDGFNLYHSIVESNQRELDAHQPATFYRFKWLDLRKLAQFFVSPADTLVEVFYFTALATWSVRKTEKHKRFIRANP